MDIVLFLVGAAVGSFVNVITLRYKPAAFLFSKKALGGRSHCPDCRATLSSVELIPLLSFIFQGGRCRHCRGRISLQYPLVELACGLLFIFVPRALHSGFYFLDSGFYFIAGLWLLAFVILLIVFLIDLRTKIIPDEANVALAIIGVILAALTASQFELISGSFVGPYAALFGLRGSIWTNRAAAALLALFFFGGLVIVTRGRGMGMGDVKLGAALGLLFGWPDVALVAALAFVSGSLASLVMIARGQKTLKSFLPFGPFLALGSFLVFAFGEDILKLYFALFPL